MDMFNSIEFWVAVGQIIMIDILLGGDNAVVIALACRRLSPRQRMQGILWGTAGAIVLRVLLIFFALQLLAIPLLKIGGALLLLWIGVKLLLPQPGDGHADIRSNDRLWDAVKTVIVADFVMSLDNVIAIAGAAEASGTGHGIKLVIFGVIVSIPIIVWGSQLVIRLMDRIPVIVTFGGMLLGWIAGTMAVTDPALVDPDTLASWPKIAPTDALRYGAGVLGALIVVGVGRLLRGREAAIPAAAAEPAVARRLRRILLAVDGSEASQRATRQVIEMSRDLARPGPPAVHLIHVQRPVTGNVSSFVTSRTLEEYYQEQNETALAPSRQMLDAAGVPYTTQARVGSPGEAIVQTAQELNCDLIVMGTKGIGAAATLLGSVTQSTLEGASVPVLLVK